MNGRFFDKPMLFSSTLGLVILTLLASCTKDPQPDNLIHEDTYIDILVEFQLIKSQHNLPTDSSAVLDSVKQLIYENYEISEEQFLNSHEFYQQQVENQLRRTDEAIQRLQQERDKIDAHIDSLQNDTTDVDTAAVDTLTQESQLPQN